MSNFISLFWDGFTAVFLHMDEFLNLLPVLLGAWVGAFILVFGSVAVIFTIKHALKKIWRVKS